MDYQRILELMPEAQVIMGIDFGQSRDYTAISVIERKYLPASALYNAEVRGYSESRLEGRIDVRCEYHIRHLERLPLRTPYTDQVQHIIELVHKIGGRLIIVADGTGVGRGVLDLLWREVAPTLKGTKIRVRPCNVTITGGSTLTKNPWGGWNVPKRDLVHSPLILMQAGLLKVAESLELKDTFVKELLNFRIKINISTAHDSYEAWRENEHDDLVLAVSLPCWAAERFAKRREYVALPGYFKADAPIFHAG
jgi:hypothetical protein